MVSSGYAKKTSTHTHIDRLVLFFFISNRSGKIDSFSFLEDVNDGKEEACFHLTKKSMLLFLFFSIKFLLYKRNLGNLLKTVCERVVDDNVEGEKKNLI